MRPVPHSEEYPVPHPPKQMDLSDADELSEADVKKEKDDPDFEPTSSLRKPHLLSQRDLNDLIEIFGITFTSDHTSQR